jgi:hypothetical protein
VTSYATESRKCSNCGQEVELRLLLSTSTFGSPDLDLRPPKMGRSTMRDWLQECLQCGYVNDDIRKPTGGAGSVLTSAAFVELAQDDSLPELARRFARYSLLQSANPRVAGIALIRAAWACDDANQPEEAKGFRSRAADTLLPLHASPDGEDTTTLATILVDVLRRAERFGEAKDLARSLQSHTTVQSNELMLSVLDFQISLCEAGDVASHILDECLPAGSKKP